MPIHRFAAPRGDIVEFLVTSSALDGNLLGDPITRRAAVHLLPGYDLGDVDYACGAGWSLANE